MRYSCEEGYDSAEGYSIGETDSGAMGWIGLRLSLKLGGSSLL